MLSECGEREDGFNTNRHSQRGRWERGKYTTIKTNTKNYKTSSTCQEDFASIKKHFCTITCQDGLWHVAVNNRDFKFKIEVV